MVVLLALLAACSFAFGNVLQQKGALETPAGAGDPRFLVQILRRPIWLLGGVLQAAGWILQAAALDRGSLVVVQSLTATSLVIALPIGARVTDQRIDRRVAVGALGMVVGIVLFLSVGSPQGGTDHPEATAWWSAGLVATAAVVLLAGLGRHRSSASKALFFGSAAGVAFALQSSVTKEFTTQLGHGLATILTSWTVYVLIGSAVVGFVLQQAALKTGVLAPAMASSNAVTLFATVLLGISVFGEKLSNGSGRLGPALIGLALALAGIAMLAGTEPPDPARPATTGVPPSRTGTDYA